MRRGIRKANTANAAGSCKKFVFGPTGDLNSALSVQLNDGEPWKQVDLEDMRASNRMFAIEGLESTNMWSLGSVGEPGHEKSVIWHTTGDTWKVVQGPSVGASADWRNMDVLADGAVWVTGDADGRIVLAKFVPSSCSSGDELIR